MRLNKYIASCGVCSRRKADELILKGLVTVNGTKITDFMDVNPDTDVVSVNGEIIHMEETKYYIALNKPKGYITSLSDNFGRHDVTELVDDISARVFTVGRLDYLTSGLLIMTNDGDFANLITHPKNIVYKTYIAHINGILNPSQLNILRNGVMLSDGKTSPSKVKVLKVYPTSSEIEISIYEGKNRQIRRMFEALGFKTIDLKRVSVGNIQLGNLPLSRWRHLTSHEINFFKKHELKIEKRK